MILSNRKISARQLNRLILTAGTGTLMLLLPDVAGNSEAGVAALFVAFGFTLIHLKIVFWLVNRDMAVRVIRNLAAVIEFVKCLALSAGLLLAAANTVRTILLPGKSFALVAAAWLAGVVFLACAGMETMGRFAEAVWLIALLPLAFLLLLCLAHIGKHGSIAEGALISATTLKNSAVGILLRGILYSAVFAPVELIYWCRDKIAWEWAESRSSENPDSAETGKLQNLTGADAVNLESDEGKEKGAYRKTEHAIMSAICIVFIFGTLFTAAAVGILGIQGIQVTEHSAMAVAAGLDVMGAIAAKKQGIAVLFFLTGMLTASGILLGQMVGFARMAVEKKNSVNVQSGRRKNRRVYDRNGGNRRKNRVTALCLALLIWCAATGLYGRFGNPASGEKTAGNGNNTEIADRMDTEENSGTADSVDTEENYATSFASLTATAQIEDRAYCTAIGIDLAGEPENTQSYDETDGNVSVQNTIEESEREKNEVSAYIFTIEIAQGSDMEATFVTCEADSLAEAADAFNANSNRELDVSHLQILLLGSSLLQTETYKKVLLEFGNAAEYYFGGTLLAFTAGTANEYMESYADSYDSEGTAVGLHLKKRFEQGLESEKAVLGTVYYRWINQAEEEPAEWIPMLE